VGGESGPGARLMDPSWVIDIRNQCQNAQVPLFFKQWGGTNKKKTGRELEGRTWDEMPATCQLPKSSIASNITVAAIWSRSNDNGT